MAKKTFKDNPALQFISAAEEATPEAPAPEAPAPAPRARPLPGEKKSRRVQLVIRPGLYQRVKGHAAARGLSVNEYICRVLEQAAGD